MFLIVKTSFMGKPQIGLKIRNVFIEQNKVPSIKYPNKNLFAKSHRLNQMEYLYWIKKFNQYVPEILQDI